MLSDGFEVGPLEDLAARVLLDGVEDLSGAFRVAPCVRLIPFCGVDNREQMMRLRQQRSRAKAIGLGQRGLELFAGAGVAFQPQFGLSRQKRTIDGLEPEAENRSASPPRVKRAPAESDECPSLAPTFARLTRDRSPADRSFARVATASAC